MRGPVLRVRLAAMTAVAATTRPRGTDVSWPQLVRYLAYLALTHVLGLATIAVTDRPETIAVWWPAAGTSVLALLALPRRLLVAGGAGVWVVTGLANLLMGREPALAAGYGLANAAEAVVVVALLTRGGRRPALARTSDALRFLGSVAAGATTVGLVAGTAAALVSGAPGADVGLASAASHSSAVATIVPIVLAPASTSRVALPLALAQPLAAALAVAAVFAPRSALPLTFLPLPVLLWAAFMLPLRAVALELAALAVAVTTLTTLHHGPFASAAALTTTQTVGVTQAFLLTCSAATLVIACAQTERRVLSEALAERELLLRGGFLDAQVGLALLHEDAAGEVLVVQSNERAAELLAPALPLVPGGPGTVGEPLRLGSEPVSTHLRTALAQVRRDIEPDWREELTTGGEGNLQVELYLSRTSTTGGAALLTLQVVDVTERHRADVAVRRALEDERSAGERLRDLQAQQDRFVSTVSHELRTPITSILGYAEILQDDGRATAEQRQMIDVVLRNARRLGLLVDDLLALGGRPGRLPSGTADLWTVAHQCVEEMLPQAAARAVRLTAVGSPADVVCRRQDLVRIVTNLVGNAVKFTPPGGRVELHVASGADSGTLTVSDTGPGVAPADLERVFDRFYRGPGSDGVPGVGLGLALVRELAQRNGATVRLESDGEHGTVATLSLPLAPA